MPASHFRTLYLSELQELWDSENQFDDLVSQIQDKIPERWRSHIDLGRNRMQANREALEELCEDEAISCQGRSSPAVRGLVKESLDLVAQVERSPEVLTAALIVMAQKAIHFQIASYGCARTFARMLGDERAATILEQILSDKKRSDASLTSLAGTVNVQALTRAEP